MLRVGGNAILEKKVKKDLLVRLHLSIYLKTKQNKTMESIMWVFEEDGKTRDKELSQEYAWRPETIPV